MTKNAGPSGEPWMCDVLLAYLGVTAPMLVRRLRGDWPRPDHGPYFSLGRWELLVNAGAVIYGTLVAINIAWPRNAVYNALGTPHWYWQSSPVLFIGGVLIIGTLYYFLVQVKKSTDVSPSTARTAADPGADGRCVPMIDGGEFDDVIAGSGTE